MYPIDIAALKGKRIHKNDRLAYKTVASTMEQRHQCAVDKAVNLEFGILVQQQA